MHDEIVEICQKNKDKDYLVLIAELVTRNGKRELDYNIQTNRFPIGDLGDAIDVLNKFAEAEIAKAKEEKDA